jgi:hypothetical protein
LKTSARRPSAPNPIVARHFRLGDQEFCESLTPEERKGVDNLACTAVRVPAVMEMRQRDDGQHRQRLDVGDEAGMSTELLTADGVRAMRKPMAAPAAEPYGPTRSEILNDAGFSAAQREISSWPGYAPTPLRCLPGPTFCCTRL